MESKKRYMSGKRGTAFYMAWANMKTRCRNPKYNQYHRYGGRGVDYCEKWESFKGFEEDMFSSYVKGLSLDRIDNNKGYSKDNCKWSTRVEQCNNRSSSRMIEFNGKIQTLSQWIKELGLKSSTVRQRYYGYKHTLENCFK